MQTDQTLSAIFNVLGDLNGDGYVDCADQAILQAHYGQPGTLLEGDLNGDGTINILDLSILESHLRQPPGEGTCPAG
ncbi:MAG: dockerin type I domain-containing protein [Sciscionella sp.]